MLCEVYNIRKSKMYADSIKAREEKRKCTALRLHMNDAITWK